MGTDSGPAHIADAVGTVGVIIYAPHKGMSEQLNKWKPEGDKVLGFLPRSKIVVIVQTILALILNSKNAPLRYQ